MGEMFRVFRAYRRRKGTERLTALRGEVALNPGGVGSFIEPIASWKDGEIAAARHSAEAFLRKQPNNFYMLMICLDYYIRARDMAQMDSYAERLVSAKNPAAALRCTYAVISIVLLPLWLLGFFRAFKTDADLYDGWVAWARDYLKKRSMNNLSSGT